MSASKEFNLIEEFAENELGGKPTEITPYKDGHWEVAYGDEDVYSLRIVGGSVIFSE